MSFEKIKTYLKQKKRNKIIKYNLEIFLLFIAWVMIWRSIWGILDKYLLPTEPLLSYLVWLLIWLLIIYVNDSTLEDFIW
jgi:hypothetical protein